MTKLEMAALALASEAESAIISGLTLPATFILALNQFRKTQIESEATFGKDLDGMYKQFLASQSELSLASQNKLFLVRQTGLCPVIEISKRRK